MQTRQSYNVAVTMRNTGTTTWAPGANYNLGSQNTPHDQIWGLNRVSLASPVAPGQQYTFNVHVTAPAPDDYTMQWRMVQDGVEWFVGTAANQVTVTEDLSRVTFIHTDGLGSPVARTDGNGNPVSQTRYEPYGYVASGATPTIGFTGHVNDADTGLTYMQQRYYDPVAGRFLSIDPVTTDANTGGSFNRYSYAGNNPYRYVDPDGRQSQRVARDNGGQTCTVEANTNMVGAAAMTVGAAVWNAGVGVYEAVSRNSTSSQSASTDSSIAKDKDDSFSVRVQAQGTSLKNDASVPLLGSTPIKADAVQYALKVTEAQLTPKEQEQMAPAFEKASSWVESVRAAGGVSMTGTSKSFNLPGVSGKKARVDIEIIRGPINIVP